MKRHTGAGEVHFDDFGLSSFSFGPGQVPGPRPAHVQSGSHTHLELEMLLVESESMTLEFCNRERRIRPGELAAYWGGLPHQVVDLGPATIYHVAQVPIVDVLSWIGWAGILDRLLRGEFLLASLTAEEFTSDRLAFARWSSDLEGGDAHLGAIVELEIRARLNRMVHSISPQDRQPERDSRATRSAQVAAAAIRFVLRHFMEHITVDDVAREVGRNRDHLMASFRRVCGLTLWEYVTRVRLSEAQRLLTATDLPVLAVCHRSGFSSTSRMYHAFRRYCDTTPAQYRHHTNS